MKWLVSILTVAFTVLLVIGAIGGAINSQVRQTIISIGISVIFIGILGGLVFLGGFLSSGKHTKNQ